jgi:hypothetical protein
MTRLSRDERAARPGVHKGDIATVLFYVAAQLDARVEHGVQGTCWGYAYRPSKNDANLISCHASGTAFDWNARPATEPRRRRTWSPLRSRRFGRFSLRSEGTVHWGGDGWGKGSTIDSMHFEIARARRLEKLAEVAEDAGRAERRRTRRRRPTDWYHGSIGTRVLSNGCQGDDVGNLQAIFNSRYPLYSKLVCDGIFGPATERSSASSRSVQVDGIVAEDGARDLRPERGRTYSDPRRAGIPAPLARR